MRNICITVFFKVMSKNVLLRYCYTKKKLFSNNIYIILGVPEVVSETYGGDRGGQNKLYHFFSPGLHFEAIDQFLSFR